jgi:hypothetical protein
MTDQLTFLKSQINDNKRVAILHDTELLSLSWSSTVHGQVS